MPQIKLECMICLTGRSPYAEDEAKAKDWAVLPACGHICHEACFTQSWKHKARKEVVCPMCRADLSAVSRRMPDGKRKRLHKLKLFFPSALNSDPESQLVGSDAPLINPDEDEEDASDDQEDHPNDGNQGNDQRMLLAEKTMVIRRLKQDLERVNSEVAGLRAERDTASDELARLRTRVQESAEAVEQANDTVEELKAHIEDLETEVEMLREQDAHKLSVELDETKAKLADAEEAVAIAQQTFEASLKEVDDAWKEEKAALELSVRKLKQQLAKEGDAGAKRIEQLEKELERHVTEKQSIVRKLESAKQEATRAKQDYDNRIGSEEADKSHMKKLNKQLETQVFGLKRAQQSWDLKHRKLKEDFEHLQAKYDALHHRKTLVPASPGSDNDERDGDDGSLKMPTPAQRRRCDRERQSESPPLPFVLNKRSKESVGQPPRAGPSGYVFQDKSNVTSRRSSPLFDDSEQDSDIEVVDFSPAKKVPSTFGASQQPNGLPLLVSQSKYADRPPARQKRPLTARRSDQHLPDFASVLYESGPKKHKRVR